jgi:hypothetical protein
MQQAFSTLLGLAAITTLSAPAHSQSLTNFANVKSRGEIVQFRGDVGGGTAISGAAVVGDFLLIVSDELKDPTVVQVLKRDGTAYRVAGRVKLPAGDDEVDLEAVAAEGDMVYVTGSHAWTRKIKDSEIDEPKRKESREQFFRFKLKPDGTAGAVEGPHSVTQAIHAHPVLKGFVGVASKENGIDIEGMAVKDGRLYFGFRGPVLRGGWVPVVSTKWDDPPDIVEVWYVQLDGRGIRDIAAVEGGFLILAGPVGDADFSYRVYFWDGADQLRAGEDGLRTQRLGEFSDIGKGKPEGLAVLKAQGKRYDLLLVRDGLPKGGPTRWKLTRP